MSSNGSYTISSMQRSDIDKMVDLLRQLFSIEADFNVDPDKQRRGLELLQESEAAEIFVVRSARQEVVAMATLQLVVSTAEGGLVAWMEDVVVDADHRGQGVGEFLLSHINRWVESRGIKRVQLVADRDNRSAIEFYKKQGWQEINLNVLRHQ
ncbi:MAG: GNAT family N-acetyltransferase [Candidatus Thiodiazotropha taylori]|uniref:GNAT family N-acetyltransferase n=1 Tax=Candidatus Thiodiazotropha taylori TaxID=2792791 RepID=A0A9E4N587_9GAMM|nr:GNAT family N-acetyltransferase [Candidatus Thiodiazotropha taylori]MCG7962633.1 GNAT family N-acetyltransferase [Candidatus Thiodiazotropha endolucinida]MCG7917759.1 GNAT family N-acetyltransferase [Candidatus Thiodiazotropha taylori]MCG7924592.1 GNAT family N-acetyltransferase [Candidatus Thiodiazotropha taylori]MCG7941836.1 GNAT family N-acetyltransferase [Candidatus Thiodiazotropha taylori]